MFRLRLGRKKVRRFETVLRGLRCYLLLLGGALIAATAARADLPRTALPVPCSTGCSALGGPNGWVSSGQASMASSGSTLYVNQQSEQAILNWQSFNIGADSKVQFNQPDASAVALNRIYQADPSNIQGALSANGQIYLINSNGMLFGPNAKVDVNSLTVSTLNVDDTTFNTTGIIQAVNQGAPAFVANGPMGSVVIQSGANIHTSDGGRVMVLAPVIENSGKIDTPGGQTILAASQDKVWLKSASTTDNLRGLLVEVGTGGSVSNLGAITANHGNITMMGFAVNQNGMLSATTTVTSNGSIKLVAVDKGEAYSLGSGNYVLQGTSTERSGQAAQVTFGANSQTSVLPELDDKTTTVDGLKQALSSVDVQGRKILVSQGAQIVVTGGNVNLTATAAPASAAQAGAARNDSQVVLESGSLIDVSGTTSTVLAMSRNEVNVQLFGNELADSPLQRNGVLKGQTVTVDARKGTTIANVSGALAMIQRDVGERLAAAGTVTVASEGDVVMDKGAKVDISGGQVTYDAGWINTTKLTSQGKVYDISSADPNIIYDGVTGGNSNSYSRYDTKWGMTQRWDVNGPASQGQYEAGYVQGMNAGSFNVTASAVSLNGSVEAHVTNGVNQTDPQQLPQLGGVVVDLTTLGQSGIKYKPANLIFATAAAASGSGPLDPSANITIDPQLLLEGGVGRLTVLSGGAVTVPEGTALHLPAGGSLNLSGSAITMDGTISVPAGKVTLKSAQNQGIVNLPLTVGGHGSIDVSGLWVNDYELPGNGASSTANGTSVPWFKDGGSVTLGAGGDLTLAAGSLINADGGGVVDAAGKLHAGNGGTISLTSRVPLTGGSTMALAGDLHAYGLGQGGRLDIEANALRIAADGGATTPGELLLTPQFFQQGGFNNYALSSNLNGITVAAGTVVRPQAQTLQLNNDFAKHATGEDISSFSSLVLLPDAQRTPVNLSLTLSQMAAKVVTPAHFEIGAGAVIAADAGATLTLSSDNSIDVNGTLSAPGGQIGLNITLPKNTAAESYYQAGQGIFLGSGARLLTTGVAVTTPNALGQPLGQVLAGGQVSLTANRGQIVTEAGSLIDVSGTAATLFIKPQGSSSGGSEQQIASDAGSVTLTAAEGMVLAGALSGHGGGAQAKGGTLEVALDATNRGEPYVPPPAPYHDFDYTPRIITLASTSTQLPDGWQPGMALPQGFNGQAQVNAAAVQSGGFDSLTLRAADLVKPDLTQMRGQIDLDHVDLDLTRSIVLDAPVINNSGGDSHLGAAYVALTDSGARSAITPPVAPGAGVLDVTAQQIDLIGNVTLQGWQQERLASTGDMRLIGLLPPGGGEAWSGSLNSYSDLTLQAARLYPATLTRFQIDVTRPDGALHLLPASQPGASGPLLSAGGVLTLKADNIAQDGTVQAPFGEIDLVAGKQLVLGSGSLTSTSADGAVIPFGQTQLGLDWIYPADSNHTLIFNAPPAQKVNLMAPSIRQASGAVVDVSGGGDLSAYEFIPGLGGSKDLLAPDVSPNTFAIIPAVKGYGPYDPLAFTGAGLTPGDTLHLAAGSGLPAGDYLLLPARYALLPGAYMVTATPGTQDLSPGQALAQTNGSVIVAGYRSVAGTGIRDARWSGYAVAPGSLALTYSQYQETLASQFFAQSAAAAGKPVPLLPQDAGQLTIDVSSDLQLDGTLLSSSGKGRGARVDIAAQNLSVVAQPGAADGTVQITADSLNALDAESLLLGGHRVENAGATSLAVSAAKVTVESGAKVDVPGLLLAATDSVTVNPGAELSASGHVAATGVGYTLNGNGALLQLSAGAPVTVERSGASGAKGTLQIAAGSTLTTSGSMYLESSLNTVINGALNMTAGSLTLDASRISLGNAPAATQGLVLTQAQLSGLHMDQLTLNSRSTVDLYGSVDLNMKALTVTAAGLTESGNTTDVSTINANTLTLNNLASAATAATVADNAQLRVSSDVLNLGAGSFMIDGFAAADLSARQQAVVSGSGTLTTDGDLTLHTPMITAATGANSAITAKGALAVLALPAAAPAPIPTSLGASLALSGSAVTLGTAIQLPSGDLTVNSSSGDLHLLAGTVINVSGQKDQFDKKTVATPAGSVTLMAAGGDVSVDKGAAIDLRSVAGGTAGTLRVSATSGTLHLDGAVDAHDEIGNGLATVNLDLGALSDFSQLNSELNSSGFGGDREIRLRQGDINIATGDTVQAQTVHLTADNGAIEVYGQIAAAADKGGNVILEARNDVHLQGSARIDARATAADEAGGHVLLATTQGAISIDAADVPGAAVIDVSGTRATGDATLEHVGGSVELRAPRVGNGVAVTSLAGSIKGAESISVEAYRTYTASTVDLSLQNKINSDTAAYMANASAIASSLNMGGDPRFNLLPGVEIDSPGNLVVTNGWDLAQTDANGNPLWRFGGESGVLTLRAANQLIFNQAVSDGLQTANVQIDPNDPSSLMPLPGRLLDGNSWSFRFAGGADLGSADPMAVKAGQGLVNVGPGVQLTSGTGDIQVASGGDLTFGDTTSAIFSAGRSAGYGALPMDWMAYLYSGVYPVRGGNVTLDVAGNINGAGTHQLISDWLYRMGNFTATGASNTNAVQPIPTAWAVNFADANGQPLFQQNLGAFGGGSLAVHAGGNITSLSAVVPTTGRPDGQYSGNFDTGFVTNKVTVLGTGGALDITAGGNINGGIFYIDGGNGTISAGKSIQADGGGIAPVLALGSGSMTLQSRDDLTIQTVLNPTLLPQSNTFLTFAQNAGLRDIADSYFFTYGDKSGVALTSLTGNVTLRNDSTALTNPGNFPNLTFGQADTFATTVYPGDLSVAALQGSLYIDNSFTLFPSHSGNLSLLADGDITMHGSSQININMSDADPALFPDFNIPASAALLVNSALMLDPTQPPRLTHAATPVHSGDTQPVEIVARNGNIQGAADGTFALAFYLPKEARLVAGQDIRDILFSGQNLTPGDVSLLQAGGDIAYSNRRNDAGNLVTSVSLLSGAAIELNGPGALELQAGRNVDLGTSGGVVTVGNTRNLALASSGASVTVEAGMKSESDYSAYLEHYATIDPAQMADAVRSFTGQSQLSDSEALAQLTQLSAEQQRRLALEHFYNELAKASMLAAKSQNAADYQGGYQAIAALFGDHAYKGDLRLYFSQISTVDGGDINLLVPGGMINAGLAATGGGFSKSANQLGIVAQRSGSVNAYLDGDMMVNQSRVFALDGGDITIWSQHGNIDAGRGAKSALAAPPPVVTFDNNGKMNFDYPPAIAGSGIRTAANPGVQPGTVTLAAPHGVVIANDAGIQSAGNIVIPGPVLGKDNISAAGSKVGDLSVQPPSISASVGNAGNAASNSSGGKELAAPASTTPLADSALAFLEVDVLGFGAAATTGVAGTIPPSDVATVNDENQKSRKQGKGSRLAKEKDDALPIAEQEEKPAGRVAAKPAE